MAVGVDIGAGVGAFEGLRWISSEIVICDIGNDCKVKLIYYMSYNIDGWWRLEAMVLIKNY